MGGSLLGWRTVCAVEIAAHQRNTLLWRQRDGVLPAFPVWDDVRTFDGKPWRGTVDVVSGGFPCTDISAAGKGAGIDGAASGLWMEMARIIDEVRPRFAFVENSPMLTSRGLGRVLGDLAALGFDARWGVLGASTFGLKHRRERIWIVADSQRSERWEEQHDGPSRRVGRIIKPAAWDGDWLAVFTGVRGAGDGVARNVDRTDAIRNGQVPCVAANAWRILGPAEHA